MASVEEGGRRIKGEVDTLTCGAEVRRRGRSHSYEVGRW
jgi:hypothetical protein